MEYFMYNVTVASEELKGHIDQKSAIKIITITSKQYHILQLHDKGCKLNFKAKSLHRKHNVSKMQTCKLPILTYVLRKPFLKNGTNILLPNAKEQQQKSIPEWKYLL